jgi:hypothetical protein
MVALIKNVKHKLTFQCMNIKGPDEWLVTLLSLETEWMPGTEYGNNILARY